jgi:predicted DNA-binding transcriptional regulator AlpA
MSAAAPKARAADDYLIGGVEVARILNVHPVTVHRHLVSREDFPRPHRIGGNRLSWWRSEILAFVESRRDQPHGQASRKGTRGRR